MTHDRNKTGVQSFDEIKDLNALNRKICLEDFVINMRHSFHTSNTVFKNMSTVWTRKAKPMKDRAQSGDNATVGGGEHSARPSDKIQTKYASYTGGQD